VTNGKGVDVIFEMLANVNLQYDLDLMGTSGRTVVIGSRGPIEITPRFLMLKRSDIRGLMLGEANAEEKDEIVKGILEGLDNGSLRPAIWKTYSLRDAPQSHIDIMSSESGAKGKLVLKPWE